MQTCKHTSGRTRLVDINFHPDRPPELVETEDWSDWAVQGTCEYGNCVEFCCPVCGANRYGGFGPVLCPCDDGVQYHDMRRKPSVAVKPSLRTNGVRSRRPRRPKSRARR